VLGDYAGVSDGLKQAFRRSGLYHLLAVAQLSDRRRLSSRPLGRQLVGTGSA
jgi:hypothetical protein